VAVDRAPSVAAAPAFSVPAASWEPCFQDVDTGYQCDVVRAPLDYDDPTGPTVSVAMARPSQLEGRLLAVLRALVLVVES